MLKVSLWQDSTVRMTSRWRQFFTRMCKLHTLNLQCDSIIIYFCPLLVAQLNIVFQDLHVDWWSHKYLKWIDIFHQYFFHKGVIVISCSAISALLATAADHFIHRRISSFVPSFVFLKLCCSCAYSTPWASQFPVATWANIDLWAKSVLQRYFNKLGKNRVRDRGRWGEEEVGEKKRVRARAGSLECL